MAYKVLNVDYEQMIKLRDALGNASDRSAELVQQMIDDVEALKEGWKGPNHDAFVRYFEERIEPLKFYGIKSPAYFTTYEPDNYFGCQAQWVAKAMDIYSSLEAEIDASVKATLSHH